MTKKKQIELVYVGDGRAYGEIPARDLTAEEVKRYAGKLRLLKTGLWIEPKDDEAEPASPEPATD